MFMMRAHDEWTRWIAAGGCTLLLLATWAYAGHSRSMRWSLIGVPLDVAHHAAAAAWIGGLAIVGIIAIRDTESDEMVDIVQRFARVAAVSVAVIVGSGAIPALRLVGGPTHSYLLLTTAATCSSDLSSWASCSRSPTSTVSASTVGSPTVVRSRLSWSTPATSDGHRTRGRPRRDRGDSCNGGLAARCRTRDDQRGIDGDHTVRGCWVHVNDDDRSDDDNRRSSRRWIASLRPVLDHGNPQRRFDGMTT